MRFGDHGAEEGTGTQLGGLADEAVVDDGVPDAVLESGRKTLVGMFTEIEKEGRENGDVLSRHLACSSS